MNFSGSKSPKLALKWKASKDELTMSAVNVANIQQKKIIQPSFIVQNDETSSMANRSPPTGAPKAAATPAAAPAVVKLRLKHSNSCVCRILHTMEAPNNWWRTAPPIQLSLFSYCYRIFYKICRNL